jgi:putative FmdB family regulatory protein
MGQMPLYDFRCRACGDQFEALVASTAQPPCPVCGAPDPERLLGSFAGPFTVGMRGAAAKRSNATRRAREEQRQEGFARQREERRQGGQ